MTTVEFSQEFDTLYNNIKSQSAPGLDEYEKSVFLTKAQEELVKNYFNPKSNKLQEGFDDNEKRQIDFSEIVRVADVTSQTPSQGQYLSIDDRAQMFLLPADTFIINNEQVTLEDTATNNTFKVTVVPINYRAYDRIMAKPYKEPLKRQCWRMIQSNSTTPVNAQGQQIVSEIISRTGTVVDKYMLRYIKKPQPIILADLTPWDLSINGEDSPTECELNPIVHREILDRAVELAKVHYEAGDPSSIIQVNQRNE
jgi:hypothetical protein